MVRRRTRPDRYDLQPIYTCPQVLLGTVDLDTCISKEHVSLIQENGKLFYFKFAALRRAIVIRQRVHFVHSVCGLGHCR
jgi:hypothetical protein